jgi:hypothetical protein
MTATASNTTTTRIDGTAAFLMATSFRALFITRIEVKKSRKLEKGTGNFSASAEKP